jgi:hypothetical protein
MSFIKKINTTPTLYKGHSGVKHQNGMYSVSTGTPSLDKAIGGGLTVGSITVLFEDSLSQYFSHFQKPYLAEAIVRNQKCLIVDPDSFRTKEQWLKFLPAVAEVKDVVEESKQQPVLVAAYRYQNLKEDKGLSQPCDYKYDNSKSMGASVTNQPLIALNKDLVLHLKFDQEISGLWE